MGAWFSLALQLFGFRENVNQRAFDSQPSSSFALLIFNIVPRKSPLIVKVWYRPRNSMAKHE